MTIDYQKLKSWPFDEVGTEIWLRDGHALFRARALERDTVVLNNGYAAFA